MISKIIVLSIILISALYGSDSENVTTRIIYYIHSDAGYLFHDDSGRALRSDERMLKQALCIARAPGNSEVFILHHRPAKRVLFFLTLKNIDLYHYKEGKFIQKKTYGLGEGSALEYMKELITPETANLKYKNYFLFYGHKIPEDKGFGYNASQPDRAFNVIMLKEGLSSLELNFEVLVISSCQNGTRYTVSGLSDLSGYIIASPEDLPLYHISTAPFILAVRNPGIAADAFARFIAEYSFKKLKATTLTVLTISLYNTQHLNSPLSDQDVKVWYNPPRFGRLKNTATHSGWGYSDQENTE